nr:uncharacterized protein LOC124809784 [Hydra vulgaris]
MSPSPGVSISSATVSSSLLSPVVSSTLTTNSSSSSNVDVDAEEKPDSDAESSIFETEDDSSDELFVSKSILLPLRSNILTFLEEFQNFLLGPENLRDKCSALVSVGDVKRFFHLVEAKENIADVFNVNTIRDIFISKLVNKNLNPGSIKKYLYS